MQFPEILDQDFEKDDFKLSKQAIDCSVDNYNNQTARRKRLDVLYDAYNGLVASTAYQYITSTYGVKSATQFIRYRRGKTKLDQLDGEFLNIGFDTTVSVTNRDAINAKYEDVNFAIGFNHAKPEIQKVREGGLDVYPGMSTEQVPDEAIFEKLNIRSKNETVMNHIIADKVATQGIKRLIGKNFKDLKLVAECFGKIERDINGVDVYRPINVKDAIYLESLDDPFLLRTPFMGERRLMYKHEVLAAYPNLDKEDRKKIDQYCSDPTTYFTAKEYEKINGSIAIPCYEVQWKVIDTIYEKTEFVKGSDVPYMTELSKNFYEKNRKSINRDVSKGKYTIEKQYRENIYKGVRIGIDVYTEIGKNPGTIQSRRGGIRYSAYYDYTGLLFNTINGTRISLQEMMYDLEETYDIIMFQIKREIKKIKGKVLMYDRMAMPKKETINTILSKIVEDGIIDYSSGDTGIYGNRAEEKLDNISDAIKEVDLGASESLGALLNIKADVENSMDRITGINEFRQGTQKASSTATGITTGVEASRTITYEMFYYINEYAKEVLMRLAEKTKTNWDWINNTLVLGDAEKGFIKANTDLTEDDYGVFIGDGKKQAEIRDKMRELYNPQINSGELRASDVAKAEMKDNFAEYVATLENAWVVIKKEAAQQAQAAQQAKQEELKMQLEIAREDREDRQQHEKDLVVLEAEVGKEKEVLKGDIKSAHTTQTSKNKMIADDRKAELEKGQQGVVFK